MIKKMIILMFLCIIGFAKPIKINDNLVAFSLPDQFDKAHIVKTKDHIKLIVAFEKSTGADINEYLSKQNSDFLEKHHSYFIANISAMPSFVTKLFALPKMRKYKHSILLIYDEKSHDFLKKDGMVSVYDIENEKVNDVKYISANDIGKIFN